MFGVYQLSGTFMIHSKIFPNKNFISEINVRAFDKAGHKKIIQYVIWVTHEAK